MHDWTPAEQAEHRRVLAKAIGCSPDLPPPPSATLPPPMRSGPCPACRDRRHGPDCTGPPCPCKCRAGLGLTAFLDATAPEVADQFEEVA